MQERGIRRRRYGKLLGTIAASFAAALVVGSPGVSVSDPDKLCNNMSRACIIEIAQTYLDARTDNRVRPFQRVAKDVIRWENGLVTADEGSDIVGPAGSGPSQTLFAHDFDRVWVDGSEAIFFWIIDVKDTAGGPFTRTVHLAERFLVERGVECEYGPEPCITEIEVMFCTGNFPLEPALPDPTGVPAGGRFLCNRAG